MRCRSRNQHADENCVPLDFRTRAPKTLRIVCLQESRKRNASSAGCKLSFKPRMRKAIELRELGELVNGRTARVWFCSVGAVEGASLFHRARTPQDFEAVCRDHSETTGNRALRKRTEQFVNRSRAIPRASASPVKEATTSRGIAMAHKNRRSVFHLDPAPPLPIERSPA